MVQSKFNLEFWFVSYIVCFEIVTATGPVYVLSPSHLSRGHAENSGRGRTCSRVADGCCCAENSGRMMLADGIEYSDAGVFYAIYVCRMG
jgi:hypothetical protein